VTNIGNNNSQHGRLSTHLFLILRVIFLLLLLRFALVVPAFLVFTTDLDSSIVVPIVVFVRPFVIVSFLFFARPAIARLAARLLLCMARLMSKK
jgi:hypothetical protein